MQSSVTNQSLKMQSALLLAAKIIGFGFSFMLPLLIVRNLPQEAVGVYREAFLVIANLTIILPLGVSMSAYYFLPRETKRRGATILNILLFNFVIGGLGFLFLYSFPQSLGNIFRNEELTGLAPMIGVVIWIWVVAAFLEIVALANQEARQASFFIIVAQFTKTVLMGGAVVIFATVESFIYAAIVQGVLQIIILLNYLRSRFPGFWREFDPGFFKEQIFYAVPFGAAGILWIAQNDVHNYFVGYKFSSAEFAIYAYGCFNIPLMSMLSESVTSVLMPRMNKLQLVGDRDEMIRLTVRAMQKLAFFYFPIYVFLMVTAHTFIVTLFTKEYEASVSIFLVNLTLLPLSILITDPIVRSYPELGRKFLITRICVLTCSVGVMYFGLPYFGMKEMITVAVGSILIEKFITETIVVRKLGLGWRHLPLLKNIVKTAAVSCLAGVVTYFVYVNMHEFLQDFGRHFVEERFLVTNIGVLNFLGGSLVLLVCALVFAPIYLLAANAWSLIEDGERNAVKNLVRRFLPGGATRRIIENRA